MQTKKNNTRFQIVSGMVGRLDPTQAVDLLNFLIGDLWREDELYNAIARWSKGKEKNEAGEGTA
ncbi:MAG: hypothetical protein MUP49_02215 [Dehalococcoidia bacterium]|nr:hypothetical protein [Dehalococcoidia bacterium]